jgi:hypothetical protein
VQKKQTNCEINFYILWLGIANKYGSLNCQFLKLVPPGFRAQNGKYFPLCELSFLQFPTFLKQNCSGKEIGPQKKYLLQITWL